MKKAPGPDLQIGERNKERTLATAFSLFPYMLSRPFVEASSGYPSKSTAGIL
jgi:hypothetical protein